MMNFKCEVIQIPVPMGKDKKSDYYVWSRGSGNCIIVVIDDEWHWCGDSLSSLDARHQIYPLLKETACALPDIQAIGFFPLAEHESNVYKVVRYIKKWVDKIKKEESRVYFLVDIIHKNEDGIETERGYETTMKGLEENGYPPERIRSFTVAGGITDKTILDPTKDIQKGYEADTIRRNQCRKFSSKLMEFLGIGIELHEDEIISEAIKFYAQAWEASWKVKSWDHDKFENKDSEQLRVLANWLDVPICDLYGQSAKSLMIWLKSKLWGKGRPIHGNVLRAVMKKLEIPLSRTHPIPDDRIRMPCSPCFPFLVSLRSFLLCCQEKGAPVSEIRFIDEDEKYRFRLMMKLEDAKKFENRFRKTMDTYGKDPSVEHTFTQPLRYLIYCKTDGLKDNRAYLRLFTDGTEGPVVTVEITSDYIDLIW